MYRSKFAIKKLNCSKTLHWIFIARKIEEKWERVEFFTQSFLLLGLLKMNMIGTNVFNFWSIRVYDHY
jgi:hypothetical protein